MDDWFDCVLEVSFLAALAERGVVVSSPPPSESINPLVSLVLLMSLVVNVVDVDVVVVLSGCFSLLLLFMFDVGLFFLLTVFYKY